jgi:hypothetical protein
VPDLLIDIRGDEEAVTNRRSFFRRMKGVHVPDYILIPILLVVMCVAILAVIYWGALVEERRNSRA